MEGAGFQASSWLAPLREAGVLAALLKMRGQTAEAAEQCSALDSAWAALLVLGQCRLPAREHESIARAAVEQARPTPHFNCVFIRSKCVYICSGDTEWRWELNEMLI